MSIRTKIGRMLAGWVMGLVVALVAKLIQRALAQQQTARSQQSYQSHPQSSPQAKRVDPVQPRAYKNWAVTDTIYQGMTRDELLAAYGQPQTREHESDTREVWTYSDMPVGMEVVIESGLVADWTEAAASVH